MVQKDSSKVEDAYAGLRIKKKKKFKMNTLPFRVFPLLGMFSYFNSLAPLERKKNYACKIKSTTYFLRTRFS